MRWIALAVAVILLTGGTWWLVEGSRAPDNHSDSERGDPDLIEGVNVSLDTSGAKQASDVTPTVRAPAGSTIRGVVFSAESNGARLRPLADAAVYAWRVHRETKTLLGTAITDEEGRFALEARALQVLGPVERANSGLVLWAEAAGHALDPMPFEPPGARLTGLHGPKIDPAHLVLTQGTVVRGRVLTASGVPVDAAEVAVSDGSSSCTRPDGRFALIAPTHGRPTVSVRHRLHGSARTALPLARGEDFDVGDLVLRFEANAWITGTVTHKDGTPLEGVPVSAYENSFRPDRHWLDLNTGCGVKYARDERMVRTDARGRFRYPITDKNAASSWIVNVETAPNGAQTSAEVTLPKEVNLVVEKHLLRVRTKTADGKPLARATLRAVIVEPGIAAPMEELLDRTRRHRPGMEINTQTDADGMAFILVANWATVVLVASTDGHLPVERRVTTPPTSAQSLHELVVPTATEHGRLVVRIASHDDPPRSADARVLTSTGIEITAPRWTSFPGRQTLPPGKYVLELNFLDEATSLGIDRAAFLEQKTSFTIRANEETQLPLTATRRGFLRLTLDGLESDVPPQKYETEQLYLESTEHNLWRTGRFALNKGDPLFPGIAPGSYKLVWQRDPFEQASAFVTVRAGEITDVTLHASKKLD